MSSERTVAPPTQSVADPAPLGLAGFALTTFVLSAVNAGWIPKPGEPVVLGLAFGYGGLAQLCAGMWEFKRNNTFGATAFSSYGAFWIAFALLVTFNVAKIPPAAVPAAVGMFLLAWGIFTAYMTIAAAIVTWIGAMRARDLDPLVRTAAWIAFGLAILQGTLGAATIASGLEPVLRSWHEANAALLVASLVMLTYFAFRPRRALA